MKNFGIVGKMSQHKELPKNKHDVKSRKGALGFLQKPSQPSQGANKSVPTCQGMASCPECGQPMTHGSDNDYDGD